MPASLLAAAALLAGAPAAQAAPRCGDRPPELARDFARAKAVLRARVVEVTPRLDDDGQPGHVRARLEVLELFKGTVPTAGVRDLPPDEPCALGVAPGRSYLFFVDRGGFVWRSTHSFALPSDGPHADRRLGVLRRLAAAPRPDPAGSAASAAGR